MHLPFRRQMRRHSPNSGVDQPLAGQGRVRLRGLGRRDGDIHAQHLLRLSPEDRRARFHSALSDKAVVAYARGLDRSRAWVFGAFVDGRLRAVGELIPLEGTTEGEVSISVEKAYQHAGIGKMLMLALILIARRTGMTAIRMIYVRGNDRMRALASDVGARTEVSPGVLEGIKTITARLHPDPA